MTDSEQKKKMIPVRTIFSWYWRVVGIHKRWFVASLLIYGTGVLFVDVISIVIFKRIIDLIAAEGIAARADIWMWFTVLAGTSVIHFVLFRLGDVCFAIAQTRSVRDLAIFAFSRMQRHSYEFFSSRFSGSLTSQARRFVESFMAIQDGLVFSVWMNGIQLLGIFVVIWFFSPILAGGFLISVLAIVVAVIPLIKRRRVFDEQEAEENSKLSGRFSDVVTNILNVKLFSSSSREQSAFGEYAKREAVARIASWKAFMWLSTAQNGMITLLHLVVFFFALFLWMEGKITVGTVVLIQAYLLGVFNIVWNLTHSATRLLRAIASASEMIEIFELRPGIADPEHPEPCRIAKGDIEFRDVSFRYDGGDEVFRNFTFSVKTGEKVGLIGPSGGGKTTVTKLLLRFADPQEGSILIDGQDIRNVRQDDLRSKIAYVPGFVE